MTLVLKIGGRAQTDPALTDALVEALVARWAGAKATGGMVIVHGGGVELTALQSAFGGDSTFVNGRRVTGANDLNLARMALSGSANKRLVALLVDQGIDAVGVSGEDASLIGAVPLDVERLGFVGAPRTINVRLLRHLLSAGYLPVVSPVSRNVSGTLGSTLNVNGDDAAAAIAAAVGADELILVSDVPGVLRDGTVLPVLTPRTVAELFAGSVATAGMRAKLDAGLVAAANGVARVRITDVGGISDAHRGTVLQHIPECS